jgi:gamma-glutamylaminecyclotransferase
VSADARIRIFVYGTLRRGGRYNHFMKDAQHMREIRTEAAYTLVSMGRFPGLIAGGSTAVLGDEYQVLKSRLGELDEYEGEWFSRHLVALSDGSHSTAWLVDPDVVQDRTVIESGDFVTWMHS